jgi:hypothetical protein
VHAPAGQGGQVVLHGRVLPHLGVHGRAHHHGRLGGQQGGGEQVAGDARGVAADDPGGRRDDDDQVGRLPQARVRYGVGVAEQLGVDALGGQGGERGLAHEAQRALRHHRDDMGPSVHEAAADVDRLVRRDAA